MSHNKKKAICIISFSPIYRDARVLRQIRYLIPYFSLHIIGYGPPPPQLSSPLQITWKDVSPKNNKNSYPLPWLNSYKILMSKIIRHLFDFFFLGIGKFYSGFYEIWYWKNKSHSQALAFAIQSHCKAFLANDWEALPLAVRACQTNNGNILFDAHEYAPLEFENRWYWKFFFQPMVTYFLQKYLKKVNAFVTVAPAIAKKFEEVFGIKGEVILNIPEKIGLPNLPPPGQLIHLVHHGGAIRDRKLENLIRAIAFCDRRYMLHFILLDNDKKYLDELKTLSEKLVPGRVVFHPPVPPDNIVKRIAEYDIGMCLIPNNNFNYRNALPNKFFDYFVAGLAVCVGPSPSMVKIIKEFRNGCITSSFDPQDIAYTLNRLSWEEIFEMKKASREASKYYSSDKEMAKWVGLVEKLLEEEGEEMPLKTPLPREESTQ